MENIDWTLRGVFRQNSNDIKAFLIEYLSITLGGLIVWFCALVTTIVFTLIEMSYEVSTWTDCASAGGCGLAILIGLLFLTLIFAIAWVVLESFISLIWIIARAIKIPLVYISIATLIYFGLIFFYPNYTEAKTRYQAIAAGICIAMLQIFFGYIAKRFSHRYMNKVNILSGTEQQSSTIIDKSK